MDVAIPPSPLRAAWIGGYEGADHVNAGGLALDMARQSGHLDRLEEDHRRAAAMGLRVVRESLGWRCCERGDGRIDLTRLERVEASARRHGLQVLWTLMHYGLPPGLSLHDDAFVPRFVRFARAVAKAWSATNRSGGPPVFTPINEIGFLAWAATRTDLLGPPNGLPPHAADALEVGYAVKQRLARACILAVRAMREVLPGSRFLHVEPLVHVVAPLAEPHRADEARGVRDWQWQVVDLLAGRLEPQLGGGADVLDIVGVNHYANSQWELGSGQPLDWHARDPRWRAFSMLLRECFERCRRPIVVAETGHVGSGRARWLDEVAAQVQLACAQGVPVQGLCLYPLVDRPDWNDPETWHRSGLWHVALQHEAPAMGARTLVPDYAAALRAWQRAWPPAGRETGPPPAAPSQASRRRRPPFAAHGWAAWDVRRVLGALPAAPRALWFGDEAVPVRAACLRAAASARPAWAWIVAGPVDDEAALAADPPPKLLRLHDTAWLARPDVKAALALQSTCVVPAPVGSEVRLLAMLDGCLAALPAGRRGAAHLQPWEALSSRAGIGSSAGAGSVAPLEWAATGVARAPEAVDTIEG
jgi:hypothetical protein